MKFIDEAEIAVRSGKGGSGCVSFRREKFIPRGGPDGGDGGKGGDVILETTSRKRTLYHFNFKRTFKAQDGSPGQGNQKSGKKGTDIVIELPVGTLITDSETGEIIKDFVQDDERFILLKGGRGGLGNKHFATSTHQAPKFAQPGEAGQSRLLKLELKLLADVGIIGFPNAGKSTLIRSISSATPKVGAYPFTTLTPNLGVVRPEAGEPFVVADIPGLIEGAHQGAGLGIQFLRHIERTRILIHLIDGEAIDLEDPLHAYRAVNAELSLFNESLMEKPQIIAINKMDVLGTEEKANAFKDSLKNKAVFCISAISRSGVSALVSKTSEILDKLYGRTQPKVVPRIRKTTRRQGRK